MKKTVLTFGLIAGVIISVLMDGSLLLADKIKTPSSTWPTPSWSPCPSALSLLSSPLPSSAAKPLSNPPPLPQSCTHKSKGRGVSPDLPSSELSNDSH